MGMKLKSGADLCGFQLTNFCVQGEASAPSDAALGRKYFHTNATDDVATGISLLNRERIYLGKGAWRATAYLDDIAAINEKLNLIMGDTDTDTLINNLKDLEEFLKDFSETDKLKSLLDGKLDKSGGTITSSNYDGLIIKRASDSAGALIAFENNNGRLGILGFEGSGKVPIVYLGSETSSYEYLIHSGNIGSYAVKYLGGSKADDARHSIGFDNGSQGSVNLPEGGGYISFGHGTYGGQLLGGGATGKLYFRILSNNAWSDWKTIAFTDSDITGYSAGLKHSNGTVGATVESNGRIQVGPYGIIEKESRWRLTLAGLSGVNDAVLADGVLLGSDNGVILKGSRTNYLILNSSGNVLIGATEDNKTGAKLQVNGSASFIDTSNVYERGTKNRLTCYVYQGIGRIYALNDDTSAFSEMWIGNNSNGIINIKQAGVKIYGNLHVTGNIIADKEVSAGGAGAEEGTSGSGGSVDFHSEKFMPSTSTLKEVNHNLGKDVIVQVYEEGATSDTWNLVMVDVEIVSATKLYLRFGKLENTYHKVVVMGAGV